MKKVVLLEYADEAKSFLDYCKTQSVLPADFRVVALEPEGQVFLKKLGVPYENTLPYFSNESHARALLKSEEWFKLLSEKVDIKDNLGIEETYNNCYLFYNRFYFHYFLRIIEILSGLFEKHKIDSVYVCQHQNQVHPNKIPHVQESERHVGMIAKLFSEKQKVAFYEIPVNALSKTVSTESFFRRFFEDRLLKAFRFFLARYLKRKKIVIITSLGYNMGSLVTKVCDSLNGSGEEWLVLSVMPVKQLIKKFIRVALKIFSGVKLNYFVSDRLLVPRSTKIKKDCEFALQIQQVVKRLRAECRNTFIYRGIDISSLLFEKIEKDLVFYITQLHYKAKLLKSYFGSLDIKLVVSPFARDDSLLLAEICKMFNVPSLMISHGTLNRPLDKLTHIEYYHLSKSLILNDYYSHTAIQTPSDVAHFDYFGRENKTEIFTGPLLFAKVNHGRNAELRQKYLGNNASDKVLLYPESLRERFNQRFHVYETFDEFVSSLTDIVNAINELEGVCLIIRMHPGRKISVAELKSLLPKSDKLIILPSQIPFGEMLTITDLLVNYSSTVIDEALQNNIPVLLYDKHNRYMHLAAPTLSPGADAKVSDIYYLHDSKYLRDGLQWIFANHLDKNIPESIFDRYVFREDYSRNLYKFISEAVTTK
ncbi:MAG: hypothetical protein KKB81_00875 [Candidatus Margulisbacteria bacterium]|nr:hypothetical protein [Candidatus Margulisiibacteriota bacterium]MBU1021532.1 hypothetical protein [Candidatus Margulisiibacteriota bacterium]MBU1728617.1 hypothetical protein [Candidatus Margulisiibacteriota bacterium]MBU1955804.1 hypothetical protein [Candidatus Margulisiibacteriota bacterium]